MEPECKAEVQELKKNGENSYIRLFQNKNGHLWICW